MSASVKYRGLTPSQVERSRSTHGANVFSEVKGTPWWRLLLDKFKDPLITILLVAGMLSLCISAFEYLDHRNGASVFVEPTGIFAAVIIATVLAFAFEWHANREFTLLNTVSDDEPVKVVRGKRVCKIPRREVVVGDIVFLNIGDEVPADGELIEAKGLTVDESSLTGEPLSHKSTEAAAASDKASQTYPANQALRGTKVMEGRGVMRVTSVGDNAEAGKVMQAAQIDNSIKTPLNEQLDRLGNRISQAGYIIAILVFLFRVVAYITEHDTSAIDWLDVTTYALQTVMLVVSLIVMAVPEGLPIAVTLSLAYSMRRMFKTNNLVRTMHACETMGATTVICTDKTGTLTQNQMQVSGHHFYCINAAADEAGREAAKQFVGLAMAACSTAHLDLEDPDKPKVIGNPTEGALMLWLRENGIDYNEVRAEVTTEKELPFSSERKFMATVVSDSTGRRHLLVKGAPELVLTMCNGQVAGGVTASQALQHAKDYASKAMRTLALAAAPIEEQDGDVIKGETVASPRLVLLGIVAISDPVRRDVPDAVSQCRRAGIEVKIVTGDTPETAFEVARQIGLWNEHDTLEQSLLTGQQLDELNDDELAKRVNTLKVVARARPAHKKRLVEALQSCGHVVAVTGDGTNDAPALKAAQVGLSMGDGTVVAKEASDITIIDNSFASIGRAVMWGRSLYRNIQRFLLFQLTVNVAACIIMLAGTMMGTQAPLTITQMLWVNLIMDTFAAIALASLPPSKSVMNHPPRDRRKFIITPTMWTNIACVGGIIGILMILVIYAAHHFNLVEQGSLGKQLYSLLSGSLTRHHYQVISGYEQGLIFTSFVMLQFWNLFNARAHGSTHTAFRLVKCGEFLFIAALILIGQVLIMNFANEVFNVESISIEDWVIICLLTSVVLLIGEAYHLFKRLLSRFK